MWLLLIPIDPEEIDYCIPGNDDAIRAVKLIANVMGNAIIDGRRAFEQAKLMKEKQQETIATAEMKDIGEKIEEDKD